MGRRDSEEVKWLMAREIPRLRRYAISLTNDPAMADDLVQDCLERAIRKHHQLNRYGSIRVWLYRILYTVFLDQRRRLSSSARHRHVPIEDLAEPPREAAGQEGRVVCREIAREMMNLPAEQRAALTLVVVEGLSYDEAAAALDIPVGTVRSRLSRGRETLRRSCGEPDSERAPGPPLRVVKS